MEAGACHDTTAWPFPGTAVTLVGAPGSRRRRWASPGVRGTTTDPSRAAFTACTVKVTATPLARPVSVVEVAGGFGATPFTVAVCPEEAVTR